MKDEREQEEEYHTSELKSTRNYQKYEFSENFFIRLREAMSQGGYTQKRLADSIKIKQSAVSAYCNDKGKPTAEVLYLLAKELGVSMEWLISGYHTNEVQSSDISWQQQAKAAEQRANIAEKKLEELKAVIPLISEANTRLSKIIC